MSVVGLLTTYETKNCALCVYLGTLPVSDAMQKNVSLVATNHRQLLAFESLGSKMRAHIMRHNVCKVIKLHILK